MKIQLLILVILLFIVHPGFAQTTQYLADKPGKFILQNDLTKCPGIDFISLTKNVTAVAEWFRGKDSIVNKPVGFDASVSLSGNLCEKKTGPEYFGIQGHINFSFHYFYLENGRQQSASDWSAHDIEIHLNSPINLLSRQFDEAGFNSGDPPRLEQPLEEALENLNKYYISTPLEKEITPGVRLYNGGHLLVFNPSRPDIWTPVSVKEIMEAKLAYYKVKHEIDSINYLKALADWAKLNYKPDLVAGTDAYGLIKKEYLNFTAAELDKPAFSGPDDGISTINAHGNGMPVVRFNTASWDRSLPLTAVQFLTMEYKPRSANDLEEFKRNNDGLVDYVGLFVNCLPVEKMEGLIQGK